MTSVRTSFFKKIITTILFFSISNLLLIATTHADSPFEPMTGVIQENSGYPESYTVERLEQERYKFLRSKKVFLKGTISQLDGSQYQFRDETGSIEIKIEKGAFQGERFSASEKVEIIARYKTSSAVELTAISISRVE